MTDRQQPLFIRQLDALAATMRRAANTEAELRMSNWVFAGVPSAKPEDQQKFQENSCGFVACVCGHQAYGDLTHFPRARGTEQQLKGEYTPESTDFTRSDMAAIAVEVSNDLDHSAADLGLRYYPSCVYTGSGGGRREIAELWVGEKILQAKDLEHPHLTTNSSFEDAASFIELLKERTLDFLAKQEEANV